MAFQAVHLIVNLRGLTKIGKGQRIDFPAPAPLGGWTLQTLAFLKAFAVIDLVVAAVSVAAVLAVLSGRTGFRPLALLCLCMAAYAAAVFDLATWWSGAWRGPAFWSYAAINALFAPVVVLLIVTLRRERP